MTWDEVFDSAETILEDKMPVRQARTLNREGRVEEAMKKLVDAVDRERRRLRNYSVSGRVSSSIVALDILQSKICRKNVVMSVKSTFPVIRQSLRDSWFFSKVTEPVAKIVENISIPLPNGGTIEGRPVAGAMRLAAKAVGAGWSILKNKDGARDSLKKACGAVSDAVGCYANELVDKGEQHGGVVGYGTRLLGKSIQAVHDGARKAIGLIEHGVQSVIGWGKKLMGIFG